LFIVIIVFDEIYIEQETRFRINMHPGSVDGSKSYFINPGFGLGERIFPGAYAVALIILNVSPLHLLFQCLPGAVQYGGYALYFQTQR
jgi:hypothetical protein